MRYFKTNTNGQVATPTSEVTKLFLLNNADMRGLRMIIEHYDGTAYM